MSNALDNTYPVDGPATAQVRLPTGNCIVTAGKEQQATVSVRPATPGRAADEKAAAETKVELAGTKLTVTVPEGRTMRLWGMQTGNVILTIGLPSESTLTFDTGSGNLEVTGTLGALDAIVGSGSLKADEITGELAVENSSGKVQLARIGARADIKLSSGSLRIDEATGPLHCEIASGKTTIGVLRGNAQITASSGKIEIGKAGPGDVRAQTASGAISVGVTAGIGVEAELSSSTGKIRGDLAQGASAGEGGAVLRLSAMTASGSIEVNRV